MKAYRSVVIDSYAIAAVVLSVVFATIVMSGIWIYQSSATTFTLQQRIREADNMRATIVASQLRHSAAVFAYAASGDAHFLGRELNRSLIYRDVAILQTELLEIDPQFDRRIVATLQAALREWDRRIDRPIMTKPGLVVGVGMKSSAQRVASAVTKQDAAIRAFLEQAIDTAEKRRQQLLARMIVGRIALVLISIVALIWLVRRHDRASRDRLWQQAELDKQRRVTDLLRQSFRPQPLPQPDGILLQAVYYPAMAEQVVGGDWYEVLELSHNRLLLIIGDVLGHGLDAAIAMNRARQHIVAAAVNRSDPAQILLHANTMFERSDNYMVAALCAIIDIERRELRYASAGHPPPLLVSSNASAEILAYGGPSLGILEDIDIRSHTCIVDEGATVFFYTDGLIENSHDVVQGESVLVASALRASMHAEPASALYCELIVGAQLDDVAIVALQFRR